jgi:23S rRNA (uridine2552-2'-O)-methyltransferase
LRIDAQLRFHPHSRRRLTVGQERRQRSKRWHREHASDHWVKRARQLGLRSRAALKLMALDEKEKLFRPGQCVLDVGASPGGWSQYAAEKVGRNGCVVAVDRLDFQPIPGVISVIGDIEDANVRSIVVEHLATRAPDLVISDMAPNITGVRSTDDANFERLIQGLLVLVDETLRPGGVLVVKLFQGPVAVALRREIQSLFAASAIRKPAASRDQSREVYLIARGFRSRGSGD